MSSHPICSPPLRATTRELAPAARFPHPLVVVLIGAEVVYLSAVSAWELSIKASIGKLRIPDDLEQQLSASAFVPLPITVAHGVAAGKLPRYHGDPFDRMLVAQASLESLTLLTADQRLKAYGIPLLLA